MSPFFAGASREQLRQGYLEAWRKARAGALLEPLEAQIAQVIEEHPEYQAWLERGASVLDEEYGPERATPNPFLHLGLHLALRDQIGTDRPAGIAAVHARLASRRGAHEAEHAMLEVLGETLYEAQHQSAPPDEQRYLERLRRL